ncbi:hypothetical protein LSH36_464g00000 [Paralvinella palmiformis]|uniref:Vesicular, overexpressed in cancer, prosurvival protein 1 n=1 Tax=Paralvinella palmiformis TaxID=53620 RepID=A0AAD9J9U2_9ANNE|nr:hypothetical protein LSH36_464g00000 [Paralvinella palmiformis]
MEGFTIMSFITLFAVLLIQGAFGYYCDSDRCNKEEYCCGENICCTNNAVWQMWYFWCGIALFVILLMVCAGLCRYKFHSSKIIILRDKPVYAKLTDPDYKYTDAKGLPYKEELYSDKLSVAPPPDYTSIYPLPPPPPPAHSQQATPVMADKDPAYMR